MRYESPRRWLLGPASTDGDGLGHSPAWLIGPSGATLGRRPDYSITSSARPSSDSGKVRPNASPSNRGDPNKNCPRFTRPRAELFCYLLPLFCSCVPCGVVPMLTAEGLSFGEILDQLRSDLAAHYLREANLSISQIAWLVGYQGVSAFSHRYKRWTGMNPKRMRDKLLASH